MDVKDAILSRRSIFKFKQEPAPSERYVNLHVSCYQHLLM